jgi:hypothetical protein
MVVEMPVSFPTLTKADACALLREIGLDLSSDEVETEQRDDRWLVSLPGQRMAWLPVTPQGAERLAMDRKLLRLLEQRCSFQVPRVLLEFGPGCDVRAMVPGIADPFPLFARVKRDSGLALRLGRSLGRVLAEQHENIRREDVIPWLRTHVTWPESGDWIRKRLPRVTDDGALRAEIERALRTYEDFQIPANDLALVHGDFGLHNVSIDPAKGDLLGVFDYDSAAWDDRHHDFRYLLLGRESPDAGRRARCL